VDNDAVDNDAVDESRPAGGQLSEEPQSERGAPGSRDTGSDEPAGGPVDRPAGQSDEDSDDTVDPQSANDPDAPELPTGDH
jgi:hypothetical protein